MADTPSLFKSAESYLATSDFDTDVALAANSDTKIATQKATKAYVDALRVAQGGVYRTVGLATTRIPAGSTVGDYWISNTGAPVLSGATAGNAAFLVNLIAADYAATGLTTKLRVRMVVTTNATACTVNIVPGLYPLSSVAGTASVLAYTLGTVTSGSTKTFTTPAASSVLTDNSGDFTFPTDGVYLLGVNVSGTTAANSYVGVQLQLQVRGV